MGNFLADGTCIPSVFGTKPVGYGDGGMVGQNDYVLRFGEVTEIIYPDSKKSIHGGDIEYTVDCQFRMGSGAITTTTFWGVTVSNVFGGVADRFHATLRKSDKTDDSVLWGTGSKVLLACPNGDQHKAVILGGFTDEQDKNQEKESDGHNLFWEFNGMRFIVDKDGQGRATFRGATNYDGTLLDSATKEAEGTNFFFDKDGGFTVATPEDKQSIKINHKDKKIEIVADSEWTVNVSGKATIEATDTITLKSAGVKVGSATDAWMKGTTYRNAEAQMNLLLKASLDALAVQLAAVAVSMTAASVSTAPALVPGAAALTSAIPVIQAMSTAIQTFEAQSSQFLSTKNTND